MKRQVIFTVMIFTVILFAGFAKSKQNDEYDPPIYIEESAAKTPAAAESSVEKFKRVYAKMSPRFRSEIKIAASDMQDFIAAVEQLIAGRCADGVARVGLNDVGRGDVLQHAAVND